MSAGRRALSKPLVLLLAVALLLAGGWAAVNVALAGGPVSWWRSRQPSADPTAADVAAARKAQGDAVAAELRLARMAGATHDQSGSVDRCSLARHDLWNVETFVSRCTLSVSELSAFSGDFRSAVETLDAQLAAQGWRSNFGLRAVLAEHYAQYVGKPNPTGSGTYTVSNLPEVTYEKQGRTLTLAFADLTAPAGNSLVTTLEPNPAGSTDYFADVRLPKVDERLGDLARTHRYVMAASVLTEYHRKA